MMLACNSIIGPCKPGPINPSAAAACPYAPAPAIMKWPSPISAIIASSTGQAQREVASPAMIKPAAAAPSP